MITQLFFYQFVVLGRILSVDCSSNPSSSADYTSDPSLSADYTSDPSLSADYSSDPSLSADYSSDPSLSADSGLRDKDATFPDFTDYEYEDILDYDRIDIWFFISFIYLHYTL